jgi:hypothetical protein
MLPDTELAHEEGAQPEAAETPINESQETGTATEEAKEEAAKEAAPKKRSDGGFQRRINELTWKTRELERQLAEATARQQESVAEPEPDFYADPVGTIRYLAKQEAEQRLAEERESLAAAQHRQQFEQTQRSFTERANSFMESHPDFLDAVAELDAVAPFSPMVAEVIGQSEAGPEIAYYLSQNLAEAQQIAMLPPHLATARIARIEARLQSKPQGRAPRAPEPPPVLSGRSQGPKDPSKMTYEEYKRWRNS